MHTHRDTHTHHGVGGLLFVVALVAHSSVLLGIMKQVTRTVADQELSAQVSLLPTRSSVVWIELFIPAEHAHQTSNMCAYARDSLTGRRVPEQA